MIPATGVMKISGKEFKYRFGKDEDAAVHAGYALGIAYLHEDLIYNINNLNKEGIYHFILTGHSQGGALANMLRAYLENLNHDEVSKKNKYKVYTFAAPLAGNAKFAKEYNGRFAENKSSYNIINPADPIPTLPLTYDDSTTLSGNLKTLLFDKKHFSFKKVISNGTANFFENSLIHVAGALGARTSTQIAKDLGPATIPPYVKDINYSRVNNVIEIKPAVYPVMLKDSALYKKKPKSEFFKKDKNGNYIRKDVMAKGTWGFQQKPYNYYVTILEMYFPEEHKALKKKYLKENL